MPDVDVAVGFGRETGMHLGALARLEVVDDDVLYKIRRFGDFHCGILLKFYGENLEKVISG